MAFSSSDPPEEGLDAGDGVSGRLSTTTGSAGGVLTAAEGEGEDDKAALRKGEQGHSGSTEPAVGSGRRWEGKGDLLGLSPT